jgi:hypothetical protein
VRIDSGPSLPLARFLVVETSIYVGGEQFVFSLRLNDVTVSARTESCPRTSRSHLLEAHDPSQA